MVNKQTTKVVISQAQDRCIRYAPKDNIYTSHTHRFQDQLQALGDTWNQYQNDERELT